MLDMLRERALPPLLDREQMLEIMHREVYGDMPPAPESVRFEEERWNLPNFAGKATCRRIRAICTIGGREFSFPFYETIPKAAGKVPFFVHVNFREPVDDRYQPAEEIVDRGFGILSFCHNDVTRDNGDFSDGLAGVLYGSRERTERDPGKIAMWAWAMSRVMDHAQTMGDRLDLSRGVACGHSRLGKTALLAAATDTRFAYAYSNDSGCSGAAITRDKTGERVREIYTRFPYWFCPNYEKYIDREHEMPFDQHYLVASVAPRRVLIGSASEDSWADPVSEQLCCYAVSEAFSRGFECPDRQAKTGEAFLSGDIGYHLRSGLHYYSRYDWNRLMDFVELHG